jgi:hypothetical protein
MRAKSRIVNFYVEPESVSTIVRAIDEEVLPRFAALPHFLGRVLLQSEAGPRPEVVRISMWAAGLENSEAISEEFRDEVLRLTGTNPARRAYDNLRIMVRDTDGEICVDL